MYDSINSKYTYGMTDVLKNKLNIRNQEELKEYEKKVVALKLLSIMKAVYEKFENNFNEERLRFIHKYLFSEVYDFAGEYREENITKDNFKFSDYRYIKDNIKIIMEKISLDKLTNLTEDELVRFISSIMTDLNVLHPFRDGNGRATREFIRELLEYLGYEIDFFLIDYDKIIEASKIAVIDESKQIELLKKFIRKV